MALTAALLMSTDTDREWAVSRPNRGGVGVHQDTNVRIVWEGVPEKVRVFLSCVAEHESSHSPWAENPTSTASGKYQFLQSTWDGNARWAKVGGKFVARPFVGKPASSAPAWVQEAVAIHSVMNDGWMHWKGTGCGHGT